MEVAGVYRFFFVVIEKKKKRNGYRYRSRSVPRCFVSFFCCFFSLFVRVAFPNCLFLPYADNEKCLFSFSFSACFFFFCWKTVTSQLLQKTKTKTKRSQ